ncbi:MAG: hypothetical protein ACRDOO_13230 [Actinomadura sp.]
MRLSPRRRTALPTLEPAPAVGADRVAELLRRYDPDARRRRRGIALKNDVRVACTGGTLTITGQAYRLARGLHHHLGGSWLIAPPAPGEHDEHIEDMLRVYVPRRLLPAEPALLLQPLLPGVTIREDPGLGLFWFNDEASELTISAGPVADRAALPAAVGELRAAADLYECGIDDVHGPTKATAEEGWRIAQVFAVLGGVPVDRYGFRVTAAADLLPR